MLVKTEKIVAGGSCLAKNSETGKNIFIPFAIPEETLEIEIVKQNRDYDTGKIVKIVSPSPFRVEPACPLYGKCGGCNMMHISNEKQVEYRKEILKVSFLRAGFQEDEIPEIKVVSGNPFGYRARFQFTDGGLNEKDSNNIVEIKNCPVATKEINEMLASGKTPSGRVHYFGDSRLIGEKCIVATEKQKENELKIIGKTKKTVKNKGKKYSSHSAVDENNTCTLKLTASDGTGDSNDTGISKNISFDVRGFFQSNLGVLEKTISLVIDGISGENVLDMYSGCGTFSVFLADSFEKITLVEHNKEAIVFAEMNLANSGTSMLRHRSAQEASVTASHESYGLSGAQWVKSAPMPSPDGKAPFDAVVIDPPRSGMEKEVSEWLAKSKTPVIKAVSCNPATQARDCAVLKNGGYRIKKLYLLDFYPQTSEIESLVTLRVNENYANA